MATTKAGTIADAVRQYAAVNMTITRQKVSKDLGYPVAQVSNTIRDLMRQGWLVKVKTGVYSFSDINRFSREAPIEDKIWNAMRINPKFTVADIARQTGSTDSYVGRKVREYRDAGWIVQRSSIRSLTGNTRVKEWAVTVKGRENIKRPLLDVFKPDPIVEAVVKLNRLICTGRAQKNLTDRETAVKLTEDIQTKLTEAIS